jgi:hypothetical protein
MRRFSAGGRVWPAALAAVVAAGCGGAATPRLAGADARPLIALAHRIGGEEACAQARDIRRLQSLAVGLVNSGRVPAALQESFLSGVNALAAEAPRCAQPAARPSPAPTPETTTTAPTTATAPAAPPAPHGKAHDHEHGKGDDGKGKGKGHGHGRGDGDGG